LRDSLAPEQATTPLLSRGGTVMNAVKGERLIDLFMSEPWQRHFTTLSESLGFFLSIYSQEGTPIFEPQRAHPL